MPGGVTSTTVEEVFSPGEFEDPLHLDDELLRMTDAILDDTARRIAALRATPEAKEGLSAFLDKRPPVWVAKD